ncbi:MAG: hypothetical protein C0595_01935 [Marinilabiliales bacterium]|nr:MAG: hypothetical protein C0595_01935 [Marinilabiliales bacterium]
MKRVLLIIVLIISFVLCNAKDINIYGTLDEIDIAPYCLEFIDKTNELNVFEVKNENWKELEGSLDFGSVKYVQWIKFNISNNTDGEIKKVLFIPYNHIHKIDLFIFSGDSLLSIGKQGTMRNDSSLRFNSGHSFNLDLKSCQKYTIVIKYNHLYRPLRASTFLISPSRFEEINWQNHRLLWFWRGAFLFAIIISLIIYFFVGLRLFLYYFILNAGIGIFMASQLGDYFIFFNVDSTDISTLVEFGGAIMVTFFFPLFLNTLVKIRERNKLVWNIMYGFIYFMIVIFVVNIFPQMRMGIVQYYSHIYIIIVATFVFLLQLIFLFRSVFYKDINAIVLFIVYCFYVGTVLLNITLPNLGFMPGNPFVYNSLLIISLIEIFTFMILMGREALNVYKDRAVLKKKEEQHQHEMMLSIIKAQEEERDRVGRTLHDSIGGSLAIIKQNLRDEDKNIKRILSKTISVVRSLSHGLVSPMVKQDEFQDELKELCYMFNSSRLKMHCYFNNWPEIESEEITTHLYRITQELIQNALKHSNARNVYFQFIGEDGTASLFYEDDGIGFNYDENDNKGLGLRNIRNRLSIMNGTLTIDSSLGGYGTTMILEIKL